MKKKLRKEYVEKLNTVHESVVKKETNKSLKDLENEYSGMTISQYKQKYSDLGLKWNSGLTPSTMARDIAWEIKFGNSKESLKMGQIVHTPGGTAKVQQVKGDKVIVVMVDGPKIPQEYNARDVHAESFKEVGPFNLPKLRQMQSALISEMKRQSELISDMGNRESLRRAINEADKGINDAIYYMHSFK